MKKLLKLAAKLLLVATVMFAVTTPAYAEDPCPWDWVPGFCPIVNNSQIG